MLASRPEPIPNVSMNFGVEGTNILTDLAQITSSHQKGNQIAANIRHDAFCRPKGSIQSFDHDAVRCAPWHPAACETVLSPRRSWASDVAPHFEIAAAHLLDGWSRLRDKLEPLRRDETGVSCANGSRLAQAPPSPSRSGFLLCSERGRSSRFWR